MRGSMYFRAGMPLVSLLGIIGCNRANQRSNTATDVSDRSPNHIVSVYGNLIRRPPSGTDKAFELSGLHRLALSISCIDTTLPVYKLAAPFNPPLLEQQVRIVIEAELRKAGITIVDIAKASDEPVLFVYIRSDVDPDSFIANPQAPRHQLHCDGSMTDTVYVFRDSCVVKSTAETWTPNMSLRDTEKHVERDSDAEQFAIDYSRNFASNFVNAYLTANPPDKGKAR